MLATPADLVSLDLYSDLAALPKGWEEDDIGGGDEGQVHDAEALDDEDNVGKRRTGVKAAARAKLRETLSAAAAIKGNAVNEDARKKRRLEE